MTQALKPEEDEGMCLPQRRGGAEEDQNRNVPSAPLREAQYSCMRERG